MPEGDTLFRAAATLRKALAGRTLLRMTTSLDHVAAVDARTPVAGRVVQSVQAHGKHLLMVLRRLDDPCSHDTIACPPNLPLDLRPLDLVVHTHLRMTGSWHIYRPGEPWQKPRSYARIALCTESESPCPLAEGAGACVPDSGSLPFREGVRVASFVAVCFSAPVVELLTARETVRHPQLADLGPDAMTGDFDHNAAYLRLRTRAELPIGVAIMDQRVLSGIGNVYKSEVLFLRRMSPFTPVASLADDALRALITEGHALLRANQDRGLRRTNFSLSGPRLWVYGRTGSACLVCGLAIRMRRQGVDGRTTYFCPQCQGAA
ncbi:MAG: DNA-formamidopyrimidine glycosylase family protein [Capsulimonadaceae bacterium]